MDPISGIKPVMVGGAPMQLTMWLASAMGASG
jgi:hypothetical protein